VAAAASGAPSATSPDSLQNHTFDLVSEGRDEAIVDAVLDGTLPAKAILEVEDRERAYYLLNANAAGERLPFLGTSTKIDAGLGIGVLTRVLYMMPARSSGTNACPFASKGCEAACLAEQTGHMSMRGPRRARRRRHASFMLDRERFMADLVGEVAAHAKAAKRAGKRCAVRLNGTTDILWERIPVTLDGDVMFTNIMEAFPDVQFYDYTKVPAKGRRLGSLPANYHLTYSLSEREGAEDHAREYIAAGYSVAVVFAAKKGALPTVSTVLGSPLPVIDGDKTDCRFLDTPGSIVGLSMKGRAKTDTSGFVRPVA
jgi:hypothetical protein